MLGQVFDKFRPFLKSTSGSVAPIVGLSLLGIIIIAGGGVDFKRAQSAKTHTQNATDAAVLAAARNYILDSESDAKERKKNARKVAKDYLQANLVASGGTFNKANIKLEFKKDGEIVGTTTTNIDMYFGGLIGRPTQKISSVSAAQAGAGSKVEIVLALDNSTSMFESGRMTMMRSAAKDFVDILFDKAPSNNSVKIGVVPWAATVNINSEKPGKWNKANGSNTAVGDAGAQTIPKAPFQNRRKYLNEPWEYSGNYSQAELNNDFAPVEWRGCISAAKNERRVDNAGNVLSPLDDSIPSGQKWPALQIEPDMWGQWVAYDYVSSGGGGGGGGTPSPSPPPVGNQTSFGPLEQLPKSNDDLLDQLLNYAAKVDPIKPDGGKSGACTNLNDWSVKNKTECELNDNYKQPRKQDCTWPGSSCRVMRCQQWHSQWGMDGLKNAYVPFDLPCSDNWQKIQTDNVLACVSDPNEFQYWKDGGQACNWLPEEDFTPWDAPKPVTGPNMNCPTAMLGMSGNRPQIIDKLNHMYPAPGGTHADVGLMWSYRMMSPKAGWTKMFGYPNKQSPTEFNNTNTKKMMVLLTDGKNDAPFHFEGYYGCNEAWDPNWPGSGRGFAGDCEIADGIQNLSKKSLDNLMLDACKTIRDSGVELYTIAVDLDLVDPAEKDAIDLLSKCAGQSDRAFNITSGQLDDTFQQLAIGVLRLTK